MTGGLGKFLSRIRIGRRDDTSDVERPSNGLEQANEQRPVWQSDIRTYSSPRIPDEPGVRPDNYMRFFKEHEGRLEWYKWMYASRSEQHEAFQHWFRFVDGLDAIETVLEFGCGYAVGYADFFDDRRYVGADLADEAVNWCRANRSNPQHDFLVCDFIAHQFDEKFDLVFSQGTIDNTYDIDGFLRSACRASRRWIYISAYRGYFPERDEHEYRVVDDQGTFYNEVSARRAYQVLRELGARDIAVFPSFTGGRTDSAGIPYETVITARIDEE